MEATNYASIGPVLQLNKAGELTQKRMKAVKVCDGLYIGEPDKRDFVRYIIECNGVMWVEDIQHKSYAPKYAAAMPKALERVKSGFYGDERFNDYRHEIDRRVNLPDSPAIMELKKPERKKPAPLAENERKESVLMLKGRTDEITEKRVVIAEVASHVYTYTYKLKRYGERVKIIFEIDGLYFQGHDTGAYVLEREDFIEVCTKAYRLARKNVANGAASGMQYFIEAQKRIDAATPTETPQISTETSETVNVSVEGGNTAERKEIEVQTIADMVAIGESLNKGESVSFKLHLHFLWSVTITNESAEWCEEFKYSLNAKCLDNPQSFGRRYTSFGLAMLHCLNRFNENANIRDDYETLSAALNKPQNLISDFRAPQSPEAPQMTECIDEPCKLAQPA